MYKIPLFILSFFFLTYSPAKEITVNLGAAAFFPLSSTVAEIYGNTLPQYQLEVNYQKCDSWSVWLNGSFLYAEGRSIGDSNKTEILLYPIGLGFKYHYLFEESFKAYCGLGITYSFLKIHDHSPYVQQHISKNQWGGVFRSGLELLFTERVSGTVFLDYFYTDFDFRGDKYFIYKNNLDMSAILLGATIGFSF